MQKELAQLLVEIMEDAGEEASIYENYSGRGMYGRTTTGLVVDNLALLLTNVIANAERLSDYDNEWLEAKFPNINSLRYDSLGNQIILY